MIILELNSVVEERGGGGGGETCARLFASQLYYQSVAAHCVELLVGLYRS